MADNIVCSLLTMPWPVVVTDPAAPADGAPVRFGDLTGIALNDEGVGGVGATETMVDFGMYVATHPVTDIAAGITAGDRLYYVDAGDRLENNSAGYFYGFALGTVGVGATTNIRVLHVPSPGSGAVGAGAIAAANIANAILNGVKVAVAANANTTGALGVLHRIDIADAATGDVDVVLDHKTRVIDAWCVKTGGAGGAANTIQVKNGANALTDAMSINIADQAIARAGSIDDAQHEIAAGGTLRVTRTKAGGNAACTVYVLGLRVA